MSIVWQVSLLMVFIIISLIDNLTIIPFTYLFSAWKEPLAPVEDKTLIPYSLSVMSALGGHFGSR